ncbi:MAG TPA: thioredoxin [Firmicutes bacterium]|jgi:thioredoxin 1|nr:thioredoxin [Bacillota bacterium]HOQ24319.1 thioredoxin [Bacillota bacterium]HPT67479.1 thioredoxin [Bacillota bacterium]
MAMTLTAENFQREVLEYQGVALVDFWAPWCGPCRMVAPTIDELAEEYAGKAKIGKVNTDENQELAAKYSVMSIPTMIIFKNGQVVDQITGAYPKNILKSRLDQWL